MAQRGGFPTSRTGRLLAYVWLALCLGLLLFAYLQRQVHDMPQAFTWGLIALTFPIGLPTGAVVGMSMTQAYTHLGLPYSPFWDLLPSWLVMVACGYWQWFIAVPALARKLFPRKPLGTVPGDEKL